MNLNSNIFDLNFNLVKNISDSPKASFDFINSNEKISVTCSTNIGSLTDQTLFCNSKKENEIKKLNNFQEKFENMHKFSYEKDNETDSFLDISSSNSEESNSNSIELIYEENLINEEENKIRNNISIPKMIKDLEKIKKFFQGNTIKLDFEKFIGFKRDLDLDFDI